MNLKIDDSGNIELLEDFDPSKFTVRTSGTIDDTSIGEKDDYGLFDINTLSNIFCKKYKTLYRRNDVENGSSIKEKLNSLKKKIISEQDFSIENYPSIPNVIKTLANSNDQYLGDIGETITELTMLSFGYNQLLSKYEGNHGLDGVFIDKSDTPECFITESKCWKKQENASTTMKNLLGEDKIHQKITTGRSKGDNIGQSMESLETFIIDNPGSVFKFAHRTLLGGNSQGAIEKINYEKYENVSGRISINNLVEHLKKLSMSQKQNLKELLPSFFN